MRIVIDFWISEEGELDLDQGVDQDREVDQDQDLKGSIENDQGTGSLDTNRWQLYDRISPQNLISKQLISHYFNIWHKKFIIYWLFRIKGAVYVISNDPN